MGEILGYFFVINGTFFFLITAIGMIRFENFYTRLHIGGKCMTGGGVSILLGIIFFNGLSLYSLKLLLIIIFLIITSPVTTHAIARAAYYYKGDAGINDSLVVDQLDSQRSGGRR